MPTLSTQPIPAFGITMLTQSALISASGADAVSFLQSQLTNDIKNLAFNRACLAGYCTPKGRLIASLLVWQRDDTVLLQIPAELQESLQKRLQMYVMRAKVKLEHVSPNLNTIGLFGAEIMQHMSAWFAHIPAAPYDVVSTESGTLMRLADSDGIARYQWIGAKELTEQAWTILAGRSQVLPEQLWNLSEIHAGIPHIGISTQEKFVPQMINYELIGAINFKKGCYPGQEIVARTHYLGKQKRRMVLAHLDSGDVHAGVDVFAAQDLTQPCGMVVNAQANPEGGVDCLVELKTVFYERSIVQLQTGEIFQWLAMPYALPPEVTEEQ